MAEAIQPTTRDLSARWVVGPMRDAALVIGTPVLIVPAVALLLTSLSVERFALYVAAFGSLGHHLPGLLRAYGDRDLFERFRVRFIVAPIALAIVCALFSFYDLVGLALMAVLWGAWHGLAQVYGFGRIYDAKARAASPMTPRIDLALCFAWFGAGLFQSPERMGDLLQKLYDCGLPLIAPGAIQGFQTAWMVGTAGVTAVFAVHLFSQWRRGQPPCLPKLLLMASSFTFWWYAMVSIENALLGIAIFEIFHDVQYLTIVWVFNLRVIKNGGRVSRFGRYLFRNSTGMIGLYVGLVFAYGLAGIVDENMAPGTPERVLAGIIVASGFLHFYYDGFIWKVREAPTQSGLGLRQPAATDGGQPRTGGSQPRSGRTWLGHIAPWSLFVVPMAVMAAGQLANPRETKIQGHANIVAAVPNDDHTRVQYASALAHRQRYDEAADNYQRAIELRPDNSRAFTGLGNVRRNQQRWADAVAAYESALRLDPDDSKAQLGRGLALLAGEDLDGARGAFTDILNHRPNDYTALTNLAHIEQIEGRYADARSNYQRAIELVPNQAEAYYGLGLLLEVTGHPEQAVEALRAAVRIAPRRDRENARRELQRMEAKNSTGTD